MIGKKSFGDLRRWLNGALSAKGEGHDGVFATDGTKAHGDSMADGNVTGRELAATSNCVSFFGVVVKGNVGCNDPALTPG